MFIQLHYKQTTLVISPKTNLSTITVINPATINGDSITSHLTTHLSSRILSYSTVRVCHNVSVNATGVTPSRYATPLHLISVMRPNITCSTTLCRTSTHTRIRHLLNRNHLPIFYKNANLCLGTTLSRVSFPSNRLRSSHHTKCRRLTRHVNRRRLRTLLTRHSPRSTTIVRPRGIHHIVHTLRVRSSNVSCTGRGDRFDIPHRRCRTL